MKPLLFLILTALSFQYSYSQQEFGKESGLIYDDTTITQLKHIVDSLNLKFKVCDVNPKFIALPQARASYVSLEDKDLKAAQADMEKGIAYSDFVKKYAPKTKVDDILVVRTHYVSYKKEPIVEFSGLALSSSYDYEMELSDKPKAFYNQDSLKGKWVFEYNKDYKYLEGFYFSENIHTPPIPEKYGRMIQYSDCMVDTSAKVFLTENSETRIGNTGLSSISTFLNYIHKETNRPERNKDEEWEAYYTKERHWDTTRYGKLDSLYQLEQKKFTRLIKDATDEALAHGGSNDEFEAYVGKYYSKSTALELKRRRIVYGQCSMDNSPRVHALNIAKLSAETVHWEIFLRAHLDIMNDRFQRMSDGSYAWAKRETYIRELEVLDINVHYLLLGICLRADNTNDNHYYGSIGRIGRALAETENKKEIEDKILNMISDTGLDEYNRVLMYFLFTNYNYRLPDKKEQAENNKKLRIAVATLPEYLSAKITIEDK